jgi:hypothetical protein
MPGYTNENGGVDWGSVFGTAGAGVAGAVGNPTNGSSKTNSSSTTTTSGTNTGTQSSNSITSPILDGETLDFRNTLMNRYLQSLAPSDWSGFRLNGLANINQNAQLQDQTTQNILAARGLNYSPVAATAQVQNQANRFGQISTFENDLPLKQMAFDQGRLNDAAGFFRSIPYATGNTSLANIQGNTNSTSSTESKSETESKQTQGGGWKGALGGIAGAAARIFLGG